MLRTRIITALVLLPIALAAIFLLTPQQFAWAAGALLLVGTWEFHRLAGLQTPMGIVLFAVQAALIGALMMSWSDWTANPVPPFAAACVAWLLLFTQLFTHDPTRGKAPFWRARGTVHALVVITFGWMAVAWLHHEPSGPWWILLLLLIIWAADVFAYFSGRAFGKRKLAPRISPGKTWAGFYGGLLGAVIVAVLGGRYLPGLDAAMAPMAFLGALTAIASVGGDLFISLHKRTVGIKDSGKIFPGHGGVLDRLDSLLAGAPFFVLGKLLAGL